MWETWSSPAAIPFYRMAIPCGSTMARPIAASPWQQPVSTPCWIGSILMDDLTPPVAEGWMNWVHTSTTISAYNNPADDMIHRPPDYSITESKSARFCALHVWTEHRAFAVIFKLVVVLSGKLLH